VVWSYLSQAGIFIQGYNLLTGGKIGTTTNLATDINSYPQALQVNANNYNKTIISWQNNNDVYVRMISPAQDTSYQNLHFAVCNLSISNVNIANSKQDAIAITLQDENSKTNMVVINAGSSELKNQSSISYNSETQIITRSAAELAAMTAIRSTISVGNCSEINRYVVRNLGDLSGATATNKAVMIAQIQDLLVYGLKKNIATVNISSQVLYEVSDSSRGAMQDTLAGLKANAELLNNINTSAIPDLDVTAQIETIKNAVNDLLKLNPESRKFKTQADGIIETIIDWLIDFLSKLDEDISLEKTIEILKEVVDTIPAPDAAQPIIEEFKDMLDEIVTIAGSFTSLSIPTTQDERIEFIAGPVKEVIISGIRIVVPPVINIMGVARDIIIDVVDGWLE
ncbi:MAG: hypothetical protein WBJ81_07325, partial [Rickettsiales bacterium]